MAERPMPLKNEAYPNNSNVARERREQEAKKPQMEKVVKGELKQRKKPLGRRFAEAFGAQEGQGVFDYIFYDIIVPATKNMLLDSISDGVEMALFGDVRGKRRRSRDRFGSRYEYDRSSYNTDYTRARRSDKERDRDHYGSSPQERRARAQMRDYEDIVFTMKTDVDDVISRLLDAIDIYGEVTVENLYDLLGRSCDYTYGNFGWYNLSTARAIQYRDGWALDLPSPRPLDRR